MKTRFNQRHNGGLLAYWVVYCHSAFTSRLPYMGISPHIAFSGQVDNSVALNDPALTPLVVSSSPAHVTFNPHRGSVLV